VPSFNPLLHTGESQRRTVTAFNLTKLSWAEEQVPSAEGRPGMLSPAQAVSSVGEQTELK